MSILASLHDQLHLDQKDQKWFFRFVAWPLSFLYGFLGQFRRFCYKRRIFASKSLPCSVISIGNIISGGSGKTPVVIALAKALRARGDHPCVLTRGYKSGLNVKEYSFLLGDKQVFSHVGRSPDDFHGDEAKLASSCLEDVPVVVGVKRFAAMEWFLSQYKEPISHIILEDGFAHLAIKRNKDILLMDHKKPFGNNQVLPLGLLREFPSVISESDAVLITRHEGEQNQNHLHPNVFYAGFHFVLPFHVRTKTALDRNQTFLLICGVANPKRVFEDLKKNGFDRFETLFFMDHERLKASLIQKKAASFECVVTTAKDFYRDEKIFLGIKKQIYLCDVSAELTEAFVHFCVT